MAVGEGLLLLVLCGEKKGRRVVRSPSLGVCSPYCCEGRSYLGRFFFLLAQLWHGGMGKCAREGTLPRRTLPLGTKELPLNGGVSLGGGGGVVFFCQLPFYLKSLL